MGVNSHHWYYLPTLGEQGEKAELEGDEWHHCYHVMRMRAHDHIIVCNGKGLCYEAMILEATSKNGSLQLVNEISDLFKSPRAYKVIIGLAPTKNIDRTEFAIEKLVEIGVDEITFLDCRHNERTHLRMDRIEKILIAAAKQSKKIIFPVLGELITPIKYVTQNIAKQPEVQILACHPEDQSNPVSENYLPGQDVIVLIGPEGGFSDEEADMLRQADVKMTTLGPFRLRVETAAIVACADIHLLNQMHTDT